MAVKGCVSPFKGKTHKSSSLLKISRNHADVSGKNNPAWREILTSVRGIHVRIIKTYGKADMCENKTCVGKSKKYDWSHKTHQYSLDRSGWQMLCKSCHKNYDFKHKINGKGKIV